MTQPTPSPTQPRFFHRLRVRWAEVDLQQIVFNGHYLMYVDTAIAAYWRALALPYQQTMHALQGDLYVRKATLEYLASARYDDVLEVGLRCARIGRSSIVFEAAVCRGEQRLVHGEIVYVFADPITQTSRPVPEPLREVLEGFEAGQPVLLLQTGDWASMRDGCSAVRQAVWAEERAIPDAAAEDSQEAQALHVLARNAFGRAVGCGRIVWDGAAGGEGVDAPASAASAVIDRLAVLHAVRGGGLGRAIVEALIEQARSAGVGELAAQVPRDAVGFFRSAGFVDRRSPGGEREGTSLQAMVLRLG